MSATDRSTRTAEADELCARAYTDAGGPDSGVALVAVGGYGRGELAPYSDWDVVLVHDEGVDLGETAVKLWYPLWDHGAKIDHSVRSLPEMLEAADGDPRVALGLLDVRHLAGDPNLTLRLRTTMLAHWRKNAVQQLPALRELTFSRHELLGELAHASVPDLKEMAGGLRDATVLNAVVATWLVDVPHVELERCRLALLDVRDVVQELAGRAVDRIAPEMWEELAARLDLADPRTAQAFVRELGRRITHLSRLTWRRVDAYFRQRRVGSPRRPQLTPLAPGVALAYDEVVLDRSARPDRDPLLLLRAAAEAAEHDVVLAPATAARLARDCAPLPVPWPEEARHLLVRLLAAGRGLRDVWDTLDETGALARILPEWERIRLLPHASVIHRFTVDRHSVETCIEAASLIRSVGRPDVLLVTALLHDIGKGELTEHSVAGAPIARAIAERMGFEQRSVDLIATLVRWHLLLAMTATTRDPEDPATVEVVLDRMDDPEALSLLTALTEADSRATSPKAWSSWRSGLILGLAARAQRQLEVGRGSRAADVSHEHLEIPREARKRGLSIEVESVPDGSRVTVVAQDRVGLLADMAATFGLQRVAVRSARVWLQEPYGITVWEVAEPALDARVLRERFEAVSDGRIDPSDRLRRVAAGSLAPSVVVRPDAGTRATVLEVRTTDRPGVVYLVAAALAALDITVRSAHVDTLGPQAVDVFYLQEASAGELGEERAAIAAAAVRAALAGE
ncbi:[protein-PII] uridylyltransferase [Nocardioides sp. BP30]|uniref:[protein-PII] uridylyltransferase n=1 Tax=Nocardioides sp. BP30 TaxID=3036374 RepID=UPI002468547A|nr:[protein-PII] uridylyltransferase [Nocardioides sp. BP30]WGL53703.1 [protein-PII] uridylyltransferase [Nocardioides sp. BP30]